DPDVAKAVWKESMEQVERGWLAGPYSWEQMEAKYGGQWVASKRFGVSQGDKVRAVDDLSQFQVNASVTETEKIQLEGLDDIVALARFHLGVEGLTGSADKTALELLSLLGWEVATQMINHAEKQAGARVTQQVLDAVQGAVDMLIASGDRQVNLWSEQPPIMLFTDGACEEEGSMVTHGAVIIDPASNTREFFGGHVPKEL
ncbi:unnamed protein product, partial [Symbiodinium microadriaticum]